MNTVSLLDFKEESIKPRLEGRPLNPQDLAGTPERYDVEIKIPQDILLLLNRIGKSVEKEIVASSDPQEDGDINKPECNQASVIGSSFSHVYSIGGLIEDIKRTSYRIGWLDGQGELRRKFIDNLRVQFLKKEQDYQNKIMKLSHLLNCKNTQLLNLAEENRKGQEESKRAFSENESLREGLMEARRNYVETIEFLEASKIRETKLARHLANLEVELEAARTPGKRWWEFWK